MNISLFIIIQYSFITLKKNNVLYIYMYANKTPGYFDKPYHNMIKFDEKKIADLFIRINKMDTHDIKQFSLIESIPLTVTNNEGNNLIHQVLLNDDNKTELQRLNMIKYLYTENVNPNAPNSNNITPLHIACRKQFETIVTFLLELGVDVNYKDNNGSTPYHYLLAGKIKIEEKQEKRVQSLIVPKQKKIDKDYVDRWQRERASIWNGIRDSPYLKAITDTIKYTMFYNGINTIKEFQEELHRVNTKDNGVYKMNKMKELKDLRDSSLNKFRNQIKSKWKIEPINEIKIHPTEENSWPQSGDADNNLSVVKDSNVYEHIKKNLDKSVASLNETNKPVDLPVDININEYYNKIKEEYDNIPTDYNNLTDINTFDKYKDNNAIDFASDIIDWNKYTFVGGSRQVRIINELSIANIITLLTPVVGATSEERKRRLVYIMSYGLINNASINVIFNNNNFNYHPGVNLRDNLINEVIQYIYKFILDELDSDFENQLITRLETVGLENYKYLLELIKLRLTSTKASWLYTFAITFKSIDDFVQNNSDNNLIVNINQQFIYLIAAFANCKSDNLELSIHQVMKPRLIKLLYQNNGLGPTPLVALAAPNYLIQIANINDYDLGAIYSGWIYVLLSESVDFPTINNNITANIPLANMIANIDAIIPNAPPMESKLNDIVKCTYAYFSNQPLPIITWLNISDDVYNKISPSEILCIMIITYYNMMIQKPLLQNIVDTISLIRYKLININRDDAINNNIKLNILNRILTIYEAPWDPVVVPLVIPPNRFDSTNTLHSYIDITLANILTDFIANPNLGYNEKLRKLFNLFNMKDYKSVELFLLTEYCMPSKINFYLSRGLEYVDKIVALQQDEKTHYLLKKIEASHLGLCFMGLLPSITRLPGPYPPFNNNNNQPDNIHYNLFYYFNNNGYNPIPPNNKFDRPYFYTDSMLTLFRPPTTFSYMHLLNNVSIKLVELQNKLTKTMTKMMKDFQIQTKSSTYGSIIGYCYPSLVAINSNIMVLKELVDNYKGVEIPGLRIDLKIEEFKIKDFETHVNSINTNLYLSYYLKTPNNPVTSVEIPKFIYQQLGKNTEIIFNGNDIRYDNPNPVVTAIADTVEEDFNSNPIIDSNQADYVPAGTDKTGSPMNEISSYHNVFTGIKEGRYFINKRIIDTNFKKTKTTKLPPSFDNPEALSLFYKLNTIQLITSNILLIQNIDTLLIREDNLQQAITNTQILFIGATMIEELVSMYLKSKIHEIGLSIYNTVIRNKLADNLMTPYETELLFDKKYNFDVDINEKPSLNLVRSINRQRVLEKLLMNYSPFTRINDSIGDIFYIYPSDYNGTNLLKSKYRVTIKDSLIQTIASRGNIFIHNNEMSSPLTYLIKNTYYQGLQLLATAIGVQPRIPIPPILNILRPALQLRLPNETCLYSMYQSNSPFTYLFEQYKNHVNKFTNGRNIKEYIQNFVKPQFDEIKNIIQANDLYNNNILVNLELSFSMCNYLCQQYLSDYMFRHRYNFVNSFNVRYMDVFPDRMKNKKSVYYIECLINARINLNSNNHNNILNSIVINYKLELNIIRQKIKTCEKEININRLIGIDIALIRQELDNLRRNDSRIMRIIYSLGNILKPLININDIRNGVDIPGYKYDKIIDRYDNLFPLLRTNSNNQYRDELRDSYIDGWKQLLNIYNNPELIISRILDYENSELTNVTNIQDMDVFINENIGYYQFMHDFVKTYFEKPFYKKDNEILVFQYDMLLHLTQNILCNSIEQIIRKILFQSIMATNFMLLNDDANFTKIMNRVDYIITSDIKIYLYGEVAQKLVINSVSIFDDAEEKESYETQTTAEILNSFLDLLVTESPIELHENTLTILKSNIVPYFDTIVNRTINNWAVCTENMFLYLINHFRLLETMSASL